MKRLFILRSKDGKTVEGMYFDNKQAAKKARDELNIKHNDSLHVSPGPDHRKYKK
jgi:hypothetical protein